MPPASRNHRTPTAGETPARSLHTPATIAVAGAHAAPPVDGPANASALAPLDQTDAASTCPSERVPDRRDDPATPPELVAHGPLTRSPPGRPPGPAFDGPTIRGYSS